MIYPKDLEVIMDYLKHLPGIGEKSAERIALSIIDTSLDSISSFASALVDAKKKLKPCSICGHLTDGEVCNICSDESRNQNLICVLEDSKNVFTFEKVGNFNGVYHVLNGLISPTEGISYDDINLSSLFERVKNKENPEVILALKSTIEGDTTTLFIKKMFEGKDVVISRLSHGIPMGAEIDYMDMLTINKALEDRKRISE